MTTHVCSRNYTCLRLGTTDCWLQPGEEDTRQADWNRHLGVSSNEEKLRTIHYLVLVGEGPYELELSKSEYLRLHAQDYYEML